MTPWMRCAAAVSGSVLVALLSAGCQGAGSSGFESGGPPALMAAPGGSPTFPRQEGQPPPTRIAAQQDNPQTGIDAWSHSAQGFTGNGTAAEMDSSGGKVVWGIWRWGTFPGGVRPLQVSLDVVVPAGGQFWLLFTDYGNYEWEVQGPLDGTSSTFDFDAGTNYVSPAGCVYVAVIVEGGNTLTVNGLNLTADADVDPPAPPTGFNYSSITSTTATFHWNPNNELDLFRYHIYSAALPDFQVGDPGVDLRGQPGRLSVSFQVTGLTPDTTYYFRMSAVDSVLNESALCNAVQVVTPPGQVLDPPTNLRTGTVSSIWADLLWDAPPAGPLGYEVYTGPTPDFQVGEPGVVKQHPGIIVVPSFHLTGLSKLTEYNVRVRAYYGQYSPLCTALTFTTSDSVPPTPDFDIGGGIFMAGVPVSFDPSSTTDPDTPPEDLTFKWDFENDGFYDETTQGPEVVQHIYTNREKVTIKLTVSDGEDVSTTKDAIISFRYEAFYPGVGQIPAPVVTAVETLGSRIAVLLDDRTVELYDGSAWQMIDAGGVTADTLADVALTTTTVNVLAITSPSGSVTWTVYSYSGGTWSAGLTQTVSLANISCHEGALAIAPSGRSSVAVQTAIQSGESQTRQLRVWHRKADDTFGAGSLDFGTTPLQCYDVQRDDTTSYFVYPTSGQVKQWSFTDSANSNVNMQAYAGTPVSLATGVDPADTAHVYWGLITDNSRVYYGDNYGTANGGSQYYTTSRQGTQMLGVGLKEDNQSQFCWCDQGADFFQHLMAYDSTANGGAGQEYELYAGLGAAGGGGGGYREEGSDKGVYAVVSEQRDGLCMGRYVVDGSISHSEAIRAPSGEADIGTIFSVVTFDDNSLLCLGSQGYPVARGMSAATPGSTFSVSDTGTECWCFPYEACITAVPDQFLVGSYDGHGMLEVDKFTKGDPTGGITATYAGTTLARLKQNPDTDETLLCYATSSSLNIEARTWDGADWSAPAGVYTGATTISDLNVVCDRFGKWGVVLLDSANKIKLIENSGGGWGSAEELSSDAVNSTSGIGCDYNPNSDLCVAAERTTAPAGIYLGIKPDGGSITWEQLTTTGGADTKHMHAYYHLTSPVVVYYHRGAAMYQDRMHVLEKLSGDWTDLEMPFRMYGYPLDIERDLGNNLVLCGYTDDSSPTSAVVAILYQ